MVLDFLNTLYPILFIPMGLVAILLGFNRALKKEEEESTTLKTIGGVSGLILLGLIIILSINEYNGTEDLFTNYSLLFGLLLGMSLIARQFKELPLAFVISVIVALGLLYVLTIANNADVTFFGSIPLEIILIIVMAIVLLVFLISFVQEQAIDGLMFILGWGPVITILGLAVLAQGITILIEFPDARGILSLLPYGQ